jgi:ketosteroid isomerase-like protein
VVTVLERFHRALAQGDSVTVLNLLAPDATVVEAGGIETRAEYLEHHLPGDIAYARAVPAERKLVRVSIQGDVALAISSSTARGRYRDREVDSQGSELAVLTRGEAGWLITAIHWSSRSRR